MLKIGVLGGTFDPVHNGHLMLAGCAASHFNLSKVLFIPTGQPPHKDVSKITPAIHRLEMLRLAIKGNPSFDVSTMECDSPEVSYTYITISKLRRQYGAGAEFYYIIGADVLNYITKFRNYKQLFDSCIFIASSRPGVAFGGTEALADSIRGAHGARIELMEFPEIDISSSQIRARVADGRGARYFVPEGVMEYIEANMLYKDGAETALGGYWESIPEPDASRVVGGKGGGGASYGVGTENNNCTNGDSVAYACYDALNIQGQVEQMIGRRRYEHTLGVADACMELAGLAGADPGAAWLAGMLHDCMRGMEADRLIAICKSAGIKVSQLENRMPVLLHAPAGAEEAVKILSLAQNYGCGGNAGYENTSLVDILPQKPYDGRPQGHAHLHVEASSIGEIKEAIASHTTGRPNMGLLAKILFVADYIEPGRDFPESYEAREMLFNDGSGINFNKRLDAAMLFILDNEIQHIIHKGRPIHPDTVFARNWLINTD